MKVFQKTGFLLIPVLISLLLSKCNKEDNNVIPDEYVDFTIDLLDPEFVGLRVIGSCDTIDATTNNWGSRSAGFDNNGIIVYRGPEEYFAFDRTCPYDYVVNGLSIRINVDFAIATCPECGTVYSIATFGVPVSGVGRYSLKNYNTSYDGERFIRVWNQ